jgi:acetyl esterase/lipase
MTSRHLVDADLQSFIAAFPPLELSGETLHRRRAEMSALIRELRHPDAACQCAEVMIPGPGNAGQLRVLVLRPKNATGVLPAVLHLHGGLYVMGSADDSELQNQMRVRELGCVVVSVDYRLAPETPFPGPLEDCYAALCWLKKYASELNVDARRIAVVGESAGGGLAAALSLLARDRAEVAVAFQQLIYPMLDDRTGSTLDPNPHAGEFVLTRATNRTAWRMYLNREPGAALTAGYASAARALDLARLPPAHISIGALDLFVCESIEYARRLVVSGVPAELHVFPGAVHAFDMSFTKGVAERFTRGHLDALGRGLGIAR